MKKRLLLASLLLIICLFPTGVVSLVLENSDLKISVEVNQGYYGDMDNDGRANDVIVKFNLVFKSQQPLIDVINDNKQFQFDVSLILPSGYTFFYSYTNRELFDILGQYYDFNTTFLVTKIELIFFDHALESGDYTFIATLTMFDFKSVISGSTSIIFDPPGSTQGPPPPEPEFLAL